MTEQRDVTALPLDNDRSGSTLKHRYELVPVTLTGAKAFVNFHHRHNEAPVGWKFGVGLARDEHLIGIAMAGRPTGRGLDQERDVEITRCCIDQAGVHKNAASRLYGAVCRMAAAGGYRNAYTYTLDEEDAASVKAAGFVLDAELPARESWSVPSRPRQDETLFGPRMRPTGPKKRWVRRLQPTATDELVAVLVGKRLNDD